MNEMINSDINRIIESLKNIKFESRNIIVTGGAGFIGSWICEVLVKQGADVYCVDNFASGRWENISNLNKYRNFNFIKHDVTKPLKISDKIDYIFHLASRASPFEFEHYPLEIIDSNTIGTRNMLEIARINDARFIFTSTSEVYGFSDNIPTPESYWGFVNPIGTRSCYDESKRLGETITMIYHRKYGIDTRIVRIFNTYGPRMRADGVYGRVIPRFITQALRNEPITVFGDGTQTRSFCYITDQVEGILRLAYFKEAKGEVVNIGNPNEISIIQLAELIKKLSNSESAIEFHPLPEDDPKRRCPNISKAEKLLRWRPKVNLDVGLKKTIEWFYKEISR